MTARLFSLTIVRLPGSWITLRRPPSSTRSRRSLRTSSKRLGPGRLVPGPGCAGPAGRLGSRRQRAAGVSQAAAATHLLAPSGLEVAPRPAGSGGSLRRRCALVTRRTAEAIFLDLRLHVAGLHGGWRSLLLEFLGKWLFLELRSLALSFPAEAGASRLAAGRWCSPRGRRWWLLLDNRWRCRFGRWWRLLLLRAPLGRPLFLPFLSSSFPLPLSTEPERPGQGPGDPRRPRRRWRREQNRMQLGCCVDGRSSCDD